MAEIIRVWVENVRQRGKVYLEHIIIIPVGEVAELAMVSMPKGVNDFFGFGFRFGIGSSDGRRSFVLGSLSLFASVEFAQFFLQIFELQAVPPKTLGLLKVFGIGGFMTIDSDAFVRIEGELLSLEQFFDIGNALLQAFDEALKNLAGRMRISRVPGLGQMDEISAIMFKISKVSLDKMHVLRIEGFEVPIEKLAGNGFIEGLVEIVQLLEQLCRNKGHMAVQRAWGNLEWLTSILARDWGRLVT